jgi:hypothetical protein
MLKEEMVSRKKGTYYRENLELCKSSESTENAIKLLSRHILKGVAFDAGLFFLFCFYIVLFMYIFICFLLISIHSVDSNSGRLSVDSAILFLWMLLLELVLSISFHAISVRPGWAIKPDIARAGCSLSIEQLREGRTIHSVSTTRGCVASRKVSLSFSGYLQYSFFSSDFFFYDSFYDWIDLIRSVDCLPSVFRDLVVNQDSPISDFYQANFENAKGMHGLPILEFIGMSKLCVILISLSLLYWLLIN